MNWLTMQFCLAAKRGELKKMKNLIGADSNFLNLVLVRWLGGKGGKDRIVDFLGGNTFDINEQCCGLSAFHHSVINFNVPVIKYLVKDLGVNTKIKTHQDDGKPQKTALELAIDYSFLNNFGELAWCDDEWYFTQFAADHRQKETIVMLYGFCNIAAPNKKSRWVVVNNVPCEYEIERTQWLERILLDWMHLKDYGLDKQPSWAIEDM